MSYAVKGVTTERGLDAGQFALVAYGGAARCMPCRCARDRHPHRDHPACAGRILGLWHALFGPALRFRAHLADAARGRAFKAIEAIYAELEAQGRAAIAGASVKPQRIEIKRASTCVMSAGARVTVDIPLKVFARCDHGAIKRLFDAMHELRYGTCAPAERAEIVSLRGTVAGVMRKPPQAKIKRGRAAPPAAAFAGKRKVYFGAGGGFRDTPTYRRALLAAGNRIKGRRWWRSMPRPRW